MGIKLVDYIPQEFESKGLKTVKSVPNQKFPCFQIAGAIMHPQSPGKNLVRARFCYPDASGRIKLDFGFVKQNLVPGKGFNAKHLTYEGGTKIPPKAWCNLKTLLSTPRELCNKFGIPDEDIALLLFERR